jgi:Tfp pilus assembly protein PilN
MRAVNLIPAEQRSGQPVGAGRSQGGAYAVLVLVAGLALMAFLYGRAQHQVTSARAHAAALTAQAQQTQSTAEKLAPFTSFIALRNQRVQDIQTLVDSRFDWAHVMHEFGRVLPKQASVSSLSGTVGSVGATSSTVASPAPAASPSSTGAAAATSSASSATPPGSVPSFTVAGCATSQSAVALTLERLRLIDGVKEVTLQSSTAGTGGASTGGGGCSGHDASFTAAITFNPLPSAAAVASATKSATKTVSDPASTGASTATTSSGVNAR